MNEHGVKQFAFHTMALFSLLQDLLCSVGAEPGLSVSQFYERFRARFQRGPEQIEEFHIINQDTIILFIWGLVALPKQVLLQKVPKTPLTRLKAQRWGDWRVELPPDDSLTLRVLVRRLRNAISHGRFTSDEYLVFTFEDRPSEKENVDFRVSIGQEDLCRFATALGDGYVLAEWR